VTAVFPDPKQVRPLGSLSRQIVEVDAQRGSALRFQAPAPAARGIRTSLDLSDHAERTPARDSPAPVDVARARPAALSTATTAAISASVGSPCTIVSAGRSAVTVA
jgi:hypothetical protein